MPQEWSGQIGDAQGAVAEASSEPVWRKERQHPAHSPPRLGVDAQLQAAGLA